jgi:hypothetical protein
VHTIKLLGSILKLAEDIDNKIQRRHQFADLTITSAAGIEPVLAIDQLGNNVTFPNLFE